MSDLGAMHGFGAEPENDSGQGPQAVLPRELDGLNWGGFAFSWIWGLGNRTYIALLALLPVVNMVMPFILLFKGNQWAWQNDRWRDIGHFKKVQRNWAIAAAIVYGCGALLFIGIFVALFALLFSSGPVEALKNEARVNPVIAGHLGMPVDVGIWVSGSVSDHIDSGDADLSVSVSGPLASGTLRIVSVKQNGVWLVLKMILTLDDTGEVIGLTPPSN